MTEYNFKGTYEPGSLDEVVGEIAIANQKREEYYQGGVNFIKNNCGSFVIGILVGIGHNLLYQPPEDSMIILSSAVTGASTPGIIYLTNKIKSLDRVELPRFGAFPMFAGLLLGQMLTKYMK